MLGFCPVKNLGGWKKHFLGKRRVLTDLQKQVKISNINMFSLKAFKLYKQS